MLKAKRVRHRWQPLVSGGIKHAGGLPTSGADAALEVFFRLITELIKVEAELLQAISVLIEQAQVDHGLAHGLARVELRRDEVQTLQVLLDLAFASLDGSLVDATPQRVTHGLEHDLVAPHALGGASNLCLLVSLWSGLLATCWWL